ncbi:hypothetical protein [Pseudonocardia sp. MH-G8]|uniref:hypothetical protein n=1 Tax=Pseudonocardia sp. MH-G8 TaxID=1854588 RepID=UPI00117A0923|nr:hypothetical protein [Pseudonocardia sp. MH-G8]
MQELQNQEWNVVHSWPDRALRVHLTSFVNLSARQQHHDHPMTTVLRRYREVTALLSDPLQVRTGSDFETRSFACVEQLRPLIGDLAERDATEVTFEQQEDARQPLLWILPMTILGEASPGWPFHLLCWNEANSLAEGFQTPYRAARHIAAEAFHEPADPFDLIASMTTLTERYEDDPASREETAAKVRSALSEFLIRAPWPIIDD